MNKLVWIMLALTVTALLLVGCKKEAAGSESSSQETQEVAKLAKAYFDMVENGTYHMETRFISKADGKEREIKNIIYAMDGKMAATIHMGGEVIKTIAKDDKLYFISDKDKAVMESALTENYTKSMEAFKPETLEFKGTGTGKFMGRDLIYEEYSVTGQNADMRFYFDGKNLAGLQSVTDGKQNAELEIFAFDSNVDPQIFEIPSDYKIVKDQKKK